MEATKTDVAAWMVERLAAEGVLYQEYVVQEIAEKFGDEWTYDTEGGGLAISRPVLSEFKKLRPAEVEWDNGDKSWS